MRARQHLHRLVPILGALAVTAVVAFPASAGARTRACGKRVVPIHATYHLIDSSISNLRPDGTQLRYDEHGSTTWSGDLRGSSTFSGGGTYDPTTGMFTSHLHEEFTGRVHGLGVGRIVWDTDTTGILGGPLPERLTMTVSGHTSAGDVAGEWVSTVSDPGHATDTGTADVLGAVDGTLTVQPR